MIEQKSGYLMDYRLSCDLELISAGSAWRWIFGRFLHLGEYLVIVKTSSNYEEFKGHTTWR